MQLMKEWCAQIQGGKTNHIDAPLLIDATPTSVDDATMSPLSLVPDLTILIGG